MAASRPDPDELAATVLRAKARLEEFPAGDAELDELERGRLLSELGKALYQLGRRAEALGPLAEAERTLARQGGLDVIVLGLRLRRATALMLLGHDEEALELSEAMTDPDAVPEIPSFALSVADIRLTALTRLGRWPEASSAARIFLDHLPSDPAPALRSKIALAHFAQAKAARESGQPQLALRAADAAIAAASVPVPGHDRPELRTIKGWAMFERGFVLEHLSQQRAAKKAHRSFIAEFRADAKSDDATLRHVSAARGRKLALQLGLPARAGPRSARGQR